MKALKLNNKFSTIAIVFIVIALPLFIWAVVNLNFNYKKKAGGNITSPIIIQESFDGNGSIDSTKWGWSGSTGSSVTLESDKLKISVLEGHDQVGGNDAVAFVYFNSLIRYATGPFDVKVDITKLETTSGQSCLKFGAYTIGICRVKKGANETIETWTGSTSTGILSDKLSGFDLPSGTDSVTVRMERTNTEINTYYDLGDGFVLSGTTNSAPQLLEDMMLPTLIVENLQTSYPATIAYFDNYYASATIITATPAPTPRDNAINWSNQWVDLTASNFYIVIDGKGLFVSNANVAINSDHGHPDNYLTLETTWYEGPNPMRLFIYFRKNSDNTWTAFEIRSYNGDPSNGDWLYYEPLSPLQLGQPFIQDNVNWYSTDGKGHIHFENLNLLPFKNLASPRPSPSPSPSPSTVNNCVPVNKVITVTPSLSGGNDPNDTDCHDIQHAIDSASGNGYTVFISPGEYFVSGQINVVSKQNLTIKGDETKGSGATVLNFNSGGGYNFLIQNSSGALQWMTIQGGSSNGMISIHNSNNFSVGYLSANSQTSHTMDIQNSSNVSVFNTELQSSAGALEILNSDTINISNNRIHNSANAISIYNSSVKIASNLIYQNSEDAIRLNKPIVIDIYSNTVADNLGSGLNIKFVEPTNSTIIRVYKNIFARNRYGIYADSTVTQVDTFNIDFNDVWSNTNTDYFGIVNTTIGQGNISSDPLFGEDYCVYNGSPVLYGLVSNGEYMGNRLYCYVSSPSPTPKVGDVNNDGKVNLIDIGLLIDQYDSTNPSNPKLDINGDGIVNVIDIGFIIDAYEW